MRSLVVDANHELSIRELPMPAYGEHQALVKTLSCGVCNGTDLKLIHGNFKNFDTYPAILGHEGVGKVIEKGSKVKHLQIGDVVLLPFIQGKLGDCYSGFGAFSEYAVVGDTEAQTVIKAEANIDPVDASMIVTFREVLSAMKRFNLQPNENVFIMGAGPVGLCFSIFAKLIGMKTVIISDIDDEKVSFAKTMGADFAFNSRKTNIKAEVKKLFPDGIDHVVDAVGINGLINEAMELVKYNGKICCYGISPELGMNLDWSKAPYNWTLQFVQWPLKSEEAEAHEQVMSWIKLGVLKPHDFISDVFDFENIIDAFKLLEERKSGTKKIVIKYY